MIEKLSSAIIRFRIPIILVVIVVTALAVYEFRNVSVRNNMAEWLPEELVIFPVRCYC